jgi:uncharacterized membrane protein
MMRHGESFLLTIPSPVVFWGILYSGFSSTEDTWSNVSQHALNSVFSFFELVFARTDPLPWIHLLWIIILLALYLGVAFITHATEHFWVYNFLDNNNKGGRGRVAGYIFAILAAAIVVFIVVKYLILLRKWITETKLGKSGRLEHRGGYAGGNEEAAEYRTKQESRSVVV